MPEEKTQNQPQASKKGIVFRFIRLLNFAAWLAIFATTIAVFADAHWLADMLTHLPFQYILISALALPVALVRRRVMFSTLLLVTIGWNVFVVSPYLTPAFSSYGNQVAMEGNSQQRTEEEASQFRIVVLNVLRTNLEIEETWKQVAETNADLIYLMEVSNQWKPLLVSTIEEYPNQKILSNDAYTGVALLSKEPWDSIEVIQSGIISNPSIQAKFVLGGVPFCLIATHPVPPFGAALTESREQQLAELAGLFKPEEANLFVGDFNVSPWSPSFSRILAAGDLRDASREFGPNPTMGPLPTWFGGLKFDHVLVNEKIVTKNFSLESVAGSDHRMLVCDFHVSGQSHRD